MTAWNALCFTQTVLQMNRYLMECIIFFFLWFSQWVLRTRVRRVGIGLIWIAATRWFCIKNIVDFGLMHSFWCQQQKMWEAFSWLCKHINKPTYLVFSIVLLVALYYLELALFIVLRFTTNGPVTGFWVAARQYINTGFCVYAFNTLESFYRFRWWWFQYKKNSEWH